MNPPTIRDVAKRAGVGVGTVSRVLNGSSQVRPDTREKVIAAIRDLGFSPNLAARQLSGGKTFTIGVASPFFTFPSFVERMAGIQDVLDDSPYDLVLYSVRSADRMDRQVRSILSQKRVDGLIVLSLRLDEAEVRRINPNLPVVVVDNDEIEHYPHIMIDNFAGGVMATRHLIARGHTAIGFIGDPVDNPFGFKSTIRRFEGFKAALEEAGLLFNAHWVRFGKYDEASARENARQILAQSPRPTALFVAIDTLALGAMAAIYDLGLRVPDDVAVIGFDDVQAASYIRLTTIRQQLAESGRWGARRLLNWLRDGELNPTEYAHKLPLELIERATT